MTHNGSVALNGRACFIDDSHRQSAEQELSKHKACFKKIHCLDQEENGYVIAAKSLT